MSAPASRPVHPFVVSLTDSTRGAEFCTWARITVDTYSSLNHTDGDDHDNHDGIDEGADALPNLVTASSNSISIYSVDPTTHTLVLEHAFGSLAGTIISLATLSSGGGGARRTGQPDALLAGFAGHPRLTVLTVVDHHLLQASTLIDLTPAVTELSFGAVSVLEQDMIVAVNTTGTTTNSNDRQSSAAASSGNNTTTAVCILGGGVAVAVISLHHHHHSNNNNNNSAYWTADEPYILPLHTLELPHSSTDASDVAAAATHNNNNNNPNQNLGMTMSTGFGDILDVAFLQGYLEPVLVLLHTSVQGRIVSGRLGSGAPPCYCTALSVSTAHSRAAVLWCVPVPCDAIQLVSVPASANDSSSSNSSKAASAAASLVVRSANSLTFLGAGGRLQQCLAVNGWARSTCACAKVNVTCNPAVPLAVQLDGARVSWLSSTAAVVALRRGQLYILQQVNAVTAGGDGEGGDSQWSMFPTGQTLGSVGEVADLVTLPFANHWLSTDRGKAAAWLTDKTEQELSIGLVFAGSRLGDSLLLGIALQTVTMPWERIGTKKEDPIVKQEEDPSSSSFVLGGYLNEDEKEILRMEEEALYGPVEQMGPDLVPPSSDDDDELHAGGNRQQKRARLEIAAHFTVVRALTPLDCLVNLGPLGPSCEGPLDRAPAFLTEPDDESTGPTAIDRKSVFGAVAHVIPSGYGSSGGLALVTVPGRDDRTIVAEQDCLYADCIFSLPTAGVVLLGMSPKAGGGFRILRMAGGNANDVGELNEVYVEEWCSDSAGDGDSSFADSWEVFQSTLLSAGEYANGQIVLVVRARDSSDAFLVIASNEREGRIEILRHHRINFQGEPRDDISTVVKVTPITPIAAGDHSGGVAFGCLWSSGDASFLTASAQGEVIESFIQRGIIEAKDEMDVEVVDEDTEVRDLEKFYADGSIVAIDVFNAPRAVFEDITAEATKVEQTSQFQMKSEMPPAPTVPKPLKEVKPMVELTDWSKLTIVKLKQELKARGLTANGKKADLVAVLEESDRQTGADLSVEEPYHVEQLSPEAEIPHGEIPTQASTSLYVFDEEDEELYATGGLSERSKSNSLLQKTSRNRVRPSDEDSFLAVCRKSGEMEIYSASLPGTLIWRGKGVNLGVSLLTSDLDDVKAPIRLPRSHKISVEEMRFFSCGPSVQGKHGQDLPARCLCISIVTSEGDLSLYTLDSSGSTKPAFRRMPLRSVARPSQEQSRHHAKLARKGVVGNPSEPSSFAYNILHRFTGISGQDGLLAAGPRPQWFVCERGRPTALAHRTRHAAPAGGKPRPISGFCSGLREQGGYVTLHERVGRVGSQRLTVYKGLSNVFDSHGLMPGSGYCVEKIPLGVTVRHIVFVDDESVSTGDHPLYAVLVSRELEVDQSEFNSDGMTDEERQHIDNEKISAKIHRQVEADLGGFDMESEWVEAIERENCFMVDMELGGAPPIHQSAYSLWVVDAADTWMVVDSYELGEYEHGIDLKVMLLTEFKEEVGSATAVASDDDPKRLFVAVGTGIVNQDGEDVSTKGRVLLFEVKRLNAATKLASSPVAELTLAFEKDVFHGPVTTLSCLSSEGKNRLVIGAGSDVNIEQWGAGKLTQVGFFRATMHVRDIMHFKNFLLLSDEYDSMYFLVWRESDKSLTLLAKDYDPIHVYAAGIMTRGAAMTFVCHDDRQNLQFFQYAPGEGAARGGNKLVCRADFYLGSQTTAFRSHFCRPSLLVHSATPASTLSALKQQDALFGRQDDDQRLGLHFGTTDGSMGSIVPLSEPVYWRLMALQSVMSNALQIDCALSHRAWRLYRRTPRRGGCRSNDRKKNVIDGDLVFKYADLATTEQEDIASAIGSTVGLILDNLLEAQCASTII